MEYATDRDIFYLMLMTGTFDKHIFSTVDSIEEGCHFTKLKKANIKEGFSNKNQNTFLEEI